MASRLGIAPRNLRLEALAGAIPSVRVGKDALLFDPVAVEAILFERARAEGAALGTEGGDASATTDEKNEVPHAS
jgi:hypothetical protein